MPPEQSYLNYFLETNPSLPILVLGPLVSGRTQIIRDFLDQILKKGEMFWQYDFFTDGSRAAEPIRDGLMQFRTRPAPNERRAVFLDNVDLLNLSVVNLLLKFLEEPPSQTIIILSAYTTAEVPATVVSRCFQYTVSPDPELLQNNPASLGYIGLAELLLKIGEGATDIALDKFIATSPWQRWGLLSQVLPETMLALSAGKEDDEVAYQKAKQEMMMVLEWWLLTIAGESWQKRPQQNQAISKHLISARQNIATEKPKTVLESLCYNIG